MRTAALLLFCAVSVWAQFRITGVVVDDVRGAPALNADVSLKSENTGQIVSQTRTRADGSFLLSVPAGSYWIGAQKVGTWGAEFRWIEAGAGKSADIRLTLAGQRVVTGRLVRPDGRPIPRADVALNNVFPGGGAGDTRTDEQGRFRLTTVRGRYFLQFRTEHPRPTRAPLLALPVTRYPPAEGDPASTVIDLTSRESINLGDIQLPEWSGTSVAGRVEVEPSLGADAIQVFWTNATGEHIQDDVFLKSGDSFLYPFVPSGDYYIAAKAGDRVFGIQRVRVGTKPVTDIVLAMRQRPQTLQVAVVREEVRGPKEIGVGLRPAGMSFVEVSRRSADEHFELDVPAGSPGPPPSYELRFYQLPPGAYIARVTQGTKVLTGAPYLVDPGDGPLQVTVKGDGAEVSLSLAPSDEPSRRGTSPSEWGLAVLRRTDQEGLTPLVAFENRGAFMMLGVPPGNYDLFLLRPAALYRGKASLDQFRDKAVPLLLAPNQIVRLIAPSLITLP